MMDQLITRAVEAAYHFGFPLDAGAVLIIELDGLAVDLDRQAQRVTSSVSSGKRTAVKAATSAPRTAAT